MQSTKKANPTNDNQLVNLSLLPPEAIVREPDVLRLFPVSRSTWWAGVKTGRYPKPVKLGARAVGWRLGAILELTRNTEEAA